jgi:hypothetical protein
LNRQALIAAVTGARATHVIHQLTALPKSGPRRPSDLDAANRLRIQGTRHLLDAALHAGARRFVLGSFAAVSPRGLAAVADDDAASAAIRVMERLESIFVLSIVQDAIVAVRIVRNPEKLARIDRHLNREWSSEHVALH